MGNTLAPGSSVYSREELLKILAECKEYEYCEEDVHYDQCGRIFRTVPCYMKENSKDPSRLKYVLKAFYKREHSFLKNETVDYTPYIEKQNMLNQVITTLHITSVLPWKLINNTAQNMVFVRPHVQDSLVTRIASRPLNESDSKWVLWQILHACAQLHELGIVHGDQKPQNVLVTSYLWLFLSDFALWKPSVLPVHLPRSYRQFYETMKLGQGCYVAPEKFVFEKSALSQCNLDELPANATFPYGDACMHTASSTETTPYDTSSPLGVQLNKTSDTVLGTQTQSEIGTIIGGADGLGTAYHDLFSIGCIFYYCLTGKHAFTYATMLKYTQGLYQPDISMLNSECSLVFQLLTHRKPHARLSAKEILRVLTRASFFPHSFVHVHSFQSQQCGQSTSKTVETVKKGMGRLVASIIAIDNGKQDNGGSHVDILTASQYNILQSVISPSHTWQKVLGHEVVPASSPVFNGWMLRASYEENELPEMSELKQELHTLFSSFTKETEEITTDTKIEPVSTNRCTADSFHVLASFVASLLPNATSSTDQLILLDTIKTLLPYLPVSTVQYTILPCILAFLPLPPPSQYKRNQKKMNAIPPSTGMAIPNHVVHTYYVKPNNNNAIPNNTVLTNVATIQQYAAYDEISSPYTTLPILAPVFSVLFQLLPTVFTKFVSDDNALDILKCISMFVFPAFHSLLQPNTVVTTPLLIRGAVIDCVNALLPILEKICNHATITVNRTSQAYIAAYTVLQNQGLGVYASDPLLPTDNESVLQFRSQYAMFYEYGVHPQEAARGACLALVQSKRDQVQIQTDIYLTGLRSQHSEIVSSCLEGIARGWSLLESQAGVLQSTVLNAQSDTFEVFSFLHPRQIGISRSLRSLTTPSTYPTSVKALGVSVLGNTPVTSQPHLYGHALFAARYGTVRMRCDYAALLPLFVTHSPLPVARALLDVMMESNVLVIYSALCSMQKVLGFMDTEFLLDMTQPLFDALLPHLLAPIPFVRNAAIQVLVKFCSLVSLSLCYTAVYPLLAPVLRYNVVLLTSTFSLRPSPFPGCPVTSGDNDLPQTGLSEYRARTVLRPPMSYTAYYKLLGGYAPSMQDQVHTYRVSTTITDLSSLHTSIPPTAMFQAYTASDVALHKVCSAYCSKACAKVLPLLFDFPTLPYTDVTLQEDNITDEVIPLCQCGHVQKNFFSAHYSMEQQDHTQCICGLQCLYVGKCVGSMYYVATALPSNSIFPASLTRTATQFPLNNILPHSFFHLFDLLNIPVYGTLLPYQLCEAQSTPLHSLTYTSKEISGTPMDTQAFDLLHESGVAVYDKSMSNNSRSMSKQVSTSTRQRESMSTSNTYQSDSTQHPLLDSNLPALLRWAIWRAIYTGSILVDSNPLVIRTALNQMHEHANVVKAIFNIKNATQTSATTNIPTAVPSTPVNNPTSPLHPSQLLATGSGNQPNEQITVGVISVLSKNVPNYALQALGVSPTPPSLPTLPVNDMAPVKVVERHPLFTPFSHPLHSRFMGTPPFIAPHTSSPWPTTPAYDPVLQMSCLDFSSQVEPYTMTSKTSSISDQHPQVYTNITKSAATNWKPRGTLLADQTGITSTVTGLSVSSSLHSIAVSSEEGVLSLYSLSNCFRHTQTAPVAQVQIVPDGLSALASIESTSRLLQGTNRGEALLVDMEQQSSGKSACSVFYNGCMQISEMDVNPDYTTMSEYVPGQVPPSDNAVLSRIIVPGAIAGIHHNASLTPNLSIISTTHSDSYIYDFRANQPVSTLSNTSSSIASAIDCGVLSSASLCSASEFAYYTGSSTGFITTYDLRYASPVNMTRVASATAVTKIQSVNSTTLFPGKNGRSIHSVQNPLLLVATEYSNEVAAYDAGTGVCRSVFRASTEPSCEFPKNYSRYYTHNGGVDLSPYYSNPQYTSGNTLSTQLGFPCSLVPSQDVQYHNYSPQIYSINPILQQRLRKHRPQYDYPAEKDQMKYSSMNTFAYCPGVSLLTAGSDRCIRYWNLREPQASSRINSPQVPINLRYYMQSHTVDWNPQATNSMITIQEYEDGLNKNTPVSTVSHTYGIKHMQIIESPELMFVTAGGSEVKVWI